MDQKFNEIAPFPTVILVTPDDKEIGTCEKIKAHKEALLHRAFSVFVIRHHNGKVQALLQKRTSHKYHSGGLWTNTCCSHPQPDRLLLDEAKRCLEYEVGLNDIELKNIGRFIYKSSVGNGLIEHELDHVFVGIFSNDTPFTINPHEIDEVQWLDLDEIEEKYEQDKTQFTAWFEGAFHLLKKYLDNSFS